jgi:phosphatidylinositol alpha-1,6-mannosyltransferase
MNHRKSILIITRNLPPLIGGMERLNWHIADELSKDHIVSIVSHAGAKKTAPKDTHFYGVPLKPLPIFLIFAFFKVFWLCIIQRPDILFAGSGLTAPIAVFWAKIFRKKSIVYIHGLDIGTNNKFYKVLWIPWIRYADKIIANSTPTYEICIRKRVNADKLSIICPGVSYPPRAKNHQFIQDAIEKYKLHDKKILISIGRFTQRKGLNEFIDLSFHQIVKSVPNTVLIIVGDTPNQALNKNLQTKELIVSTAKKHHVDEHLIFTGNIPDYNVLSSFYYLADIHVFPVKHIPDDPEGFGMVAIEAAAHCLPTVAFATGGIVDAVQDRKTGYLIENGHYDAFTNSTIKILKEEIFFNPADCQNYAEQFSWQHLAEKFNLIIKSLYRSPK